MVKRILIPVDFTIQSHDLLGCVDQFKALGLEKIILLHVVDIYHAQGLAPMFEKNANEVIKEYKQYLENIDIDSQTFVIQGEVKSTIANVGNEYDVDCIIMGSTIKNPVKGRMLGRTTDYVANNSGKMLLVEKYKLQEGSKEETYEKVCNPTFKRPMVPLDFSNKSLEVIAKIAPLQNYMDKIYLINVIKKTKDISGIEQVKKQNESKLAEAGNKLEGINVETIVSTGNPAEEINKSADAKDATLIVLRASIKGMIKKFLLGSTAYNLLNKTWKPILIIP
ncbi:universal stress protein [Methanohalobium sp.]|uniref:universal stress protein n=1 Tax=Methanohalobium sp. TaxID=2837493 RepID=UPI0025FC554C|nr:universal stress protein [Methanohalobium sp.]